MEQETLAEGARAGGQVSYVDESCQERAGPHHNGPAPAAVTPT